MRDPEQIAADLELAATSVMATYASDHSPSVTHGTRLLLREAAEALRQTQDWKHAAGAEAQLADEGAAAVRDLNGRLGKAEAERDALIRFAEFYWRFEHDRTAGRSIHREYEALPEPLRQKIESDA